MSIPPPFDLSRDEIGWLITQFVFSSKRDRDLISDRLLEGLTYEQLAEKYYLSVRQVKTIVHKCKEIVYSHVDRLP